MPEGVLQFTPGCGSGCGESCPIITMDPIPTDDDFTVVAGTWDLSAGNIDGVFSTNSSNARLIHDAVVPSGTTKMYVQGAGSGNINDQIILIFAWTDTSNFWYAQGVRGATDGEIKLFEVSGGVHTQRGSTGTLVGFDGSAGLLALQVCIYPAGIEVRAYDLNDPPTEGACGGLDYTGTPPTLDGTKLGLGTRTLVDIGQWFYLEAYKIDSESEDGECLHSCFPKDDEIPSSDCDTLSGVNECCAERIGAFPATLSITLQSGWQLEEPQGNLSPPFNDCSAGTTTLTDHEITYNADFCDEIFGNPRFNFYYSDPSSTVLCNFWEGFRIQCNQPSGLGAAMFLQVPGAWKGIQLTILDCDPLHIVSTNGLIEITE
jgi:hypothetical protein